MTEGNIYWMTVLQEQAGWLVKLVIWLSRLGNGGIKERSEDTSENMAVYNTWSHLQQSFYFNGQNKLH